MLNIHNCWYLTALIKLIYLKWYKRKLCDPHNVLVSFKVWLISFTFLFVKWCNIKYFALLPIYFTFFCIFRTKIHLMCIILLLLWKFYFLLQIGIALSHIFWCFSDYFYIFIIARIVGGLSRTNITLFSAIVTDICSEKDRGKGMVCMTAFCSPKLCHFFSYIKILYCNIMHSGLDLRDIWISNSGFMCIWKPQNVHFLNLNVSRKPPEKSL